MACWDKNQQMEPRNLCKPKKAELVVQEPNRLVVEEPKVVDEDDATVGLPAVPDALVTPVAKSKAAAPGQSTPVKRRRLDPCLRKN